MNRIKLVSILVVSLLFLGLTVRASMAAGLVVTRIGSTTILGTVKTTETVTGALPDIEGTATPGAVVALTVNAVTATTSAGLSGMWLYQTTNIVPGMNSVSIASGNETVAFLLSYSATVTPTLTAESIIAESTASGVLLETGSPMLPMLIGGAGLVIFLVGIGFQRLQEEKIRA